MILPSEFTARTKALLGEAEYARFETALAGAPSVSIRLNPGKPAGRPAGATSVPWNPHGFYLPGRSSFTFDPLFHAGAYYVQEASSMFLEPAVRAFIDKPVKCLDLCAAPGGKSTLLASALPPGSLLVSNEVIRSRSLILAENLAKWGAPGVVVTNDDPAAFGELTHFFDLVVTDVPCSGEGMFRKDPGSAAEWSVANVALCASRQRRILHDVWNALVPGGLLIYSTCTYNTEENEQNLYRLAAEWGAEILPVPANPEWNLTGALKYDIPVCRFLPHKLRGEGFFLAVMRKPDAYTTSGGSRPASRKKEKKKPAEPVPAFATACLTNPDAYETEQTGGRFRAAPRGHSLYYRQLSERLHIVRAGIHLGEIKGKDWLPSHELALSTALRPDAFSRVAVDRDTAIRYLRKEAVTLPADTAKGYVLLTYKQLPLGFVKHLGNRSNNLYPPEWRIRTSRLPEELKPPVFESEK